MKLFTCIPYLVCIYQQLVSNIYHRLSNARSLGSLETLRFATYYPHGPIGLVFLAHCPIVPSPASTAAVSVLRKNNTALTPSKTLVIHLACARTTAVEQRRYAESCCDRPVRHMEEWGCNSPRDGCCMSNLKTRLLLYPSSTVKGSSFPCHIVHVLV